MHCDSQTIEYARFFYDKCDRKQLSDYVYANPRVTQAIEFALSWIDNDAERILDIGRGIGWSSCEIKRHYPKTKIISVDLSPRLTEVAKTLFYNEDIQYLAADITEYDGITPGTVDAVVMLDVYEHIPGALRSQLHSFLDRVLSPLGTVIMTFPTVKHQTYLREHKPEGLQPVDEDVTQGDIELLAQDIHSAIVHFEEVLIWTKGDYIYAIISRDSHLYAKKSTDFIKLEGLGERRQRIENALGLSVLPGEVLACRKGKIPICIASPRLNAYCETFIQAHIEQLPAEIHVLYGAHFPTHADDGNSLVQVYNFFQRLQFRLKQQLHGLPWNGEAKHIAAIERFLRQHQIQAVLTEYGPTGVAMMEICHRMGLPLIVHFHGYDVYQNDILSEGAGQRYPELFAKAQAVVAVSRVMQAKLIKMGAPPEKVYYNPYGVDISRFSAIQPANNPPIFIGVGRFVNKKAPYLTLMAFVEVIQQIPEARLIMAGEGDLLEICQRLAQCWGIASAVQFYGSCSHEKVASLMQRARAFVQHSVQSFSGSSEGTPVAIIEASATGLPVVATRHAGIPDVIIEGETGFLVDEGDVAGMAAYMMQLARDPALASYMGEAGRKRVEKHFSMEKSITNLWEIIESAIEGRVNALR